jgi:hypothetical protein
VQIVVGIVVISAAIWVGFDAANRDWSGNRIGNKTWHWVLGTLLFFLLVLPLYLYQRGRVPLKGSGSDFDLQSSRNKSHGWQVAAAIVVGFCVIAGLGFGGWHYLRIDRANALAVKYGAAPSKGEATLVDRCVGVMREAYATSDDPLKAGVPPKADALLTPKVCALGVERDLVKSDGTMSEESGRELTLAVIQDLGPARVQALLYDELAVDVYHLAKAGEVTRLDRCVAMGYAGYDAAQGQVSTLPPRDHYRKAARKACSLGIRHGLIPESGSPQPGTPEWDEFQQLLASLVYAS